MHTSFFTQEANSINRSLSALGNVIRRLSNDEKPTYRENILTLLMEDSLGGNAKTLMLVNISPCNIEESVRSLEYASMVKKITNNASKVSESKEISHLKEIIAKLKKGKVVEEEQ